MSAQNWYHRYPTDFVHGVMGLGAAEIGAYTIILDLIYDRGGPIPNEPRWIGGILGESPRLARALIQRLMDAGKLIEVDGCLDNLRARKEREKSAKVARNLSERGANGARKRWADKENQEVKNASAIPSRARVQIPDTRYKERSPSGDPKKAARGSRLRPDWVLPLDDEAFALEAGMSRERIARTATRFKNHWLAKTGADASKLDWSRTWQNWVLKDLDHEHRGTGPPAKPKNGSAKLGDLLDQPFQETFGNGRANNQSPSPPAVRQLRDR